jgi:outer membrane protein assembly factor BamB
MASANPHDNREVSMPLSVQAALNVAAMTIIEWFPMARLYLAAFLFLPALTCAADWPMGGRDATRNPVSLEQGAPTDWQVKADEQTPRNIRWSAPVGSRAIGGPVVANGLVWVGTNNDVPLDPAVLGDRGVLACFRESDGKFLYQYTSPRLGYRTADWPHQGLSGSPVTEKDRLWFITNRREVVCLDTGPLSRGEGPAKELWKYDLVKREGVAPNSPMIPSHNNVGSPAIDHELLFVPTGNGVQVDYPAANRVKALHAPTLLCLRKDSGTVVWRDHSAGQEIYGGHTASPLVVKIAGQLQVVHPQADGWVRSFAAETGKLLWAFDTNHKDAKWDWFGDRFNERHVVTAQPVFADGRIYFAVGRDPEFTNTHGRLFCIDPKKTGDISPEIEYEHGKGKANPNSGIVWQFEGDGFAQTNSCVAIDRRLALVADHYGKLHCLDAATGWRHWTYDVGSQHFGDPLVVDGKVYVTNDEGLVTILELSKTLRVLAKHAMNRVVVTKQDTFVEKRMMDLLVASPVFANGTLYIASTGVVYAIHKTH